MCSCFYNTIVSIYFCFVSEQNIFIPYMNRIWKRDKFVGAAKGKNKYNSGGVLILKETKK